MGYKPDTVAATMGHINGNYFLPAIQREFVWTPEKVVQLFDPYAGIGLALCSGVETGES